MEFILDASYSTNMTAKERNLLIRYCVNVATRGKCATKALLRPFKQRYLKEASVEQCKEHVEHIAQYERAMQEYDPQTAQLPQWMLDYFGGVPTKEQYATYCRQIIKQERDVLRSLKRNYSVYVDYDLLGRKLFAFHNSLNPRVTFGYSNRLHEECDFAFDDIKREAFLQSSLADLPRWKGDWMHDWGNVVFGTMQLIYEDLTLYRGETCILETVSHEEMMTVRLEETDLQALAAQKGGSTLVKKLRNLKQ